MTVFLALRSMQTEITFLQETAPGDELAVTLSFTLKTNTLWAKAGHEVCHQQFVTSDNWAEKVRSMMVKGIKSRKKSTAQLLSEARAQGCPCAVVEVPLLDRALAYDMVPAGAELVYVRVPRELRLERAVGRGASAEDFAARDARQPSDAYLCAHATTILPNEGASDELVAWARAVWDEACAAASAEAGRD